MEQHYAERLLASMEKLWKEELHCDVVIKAEHASSSDQLFRAHSVVLSAASSYMSVVLQDAQLCCNGQPAFTLNVKPDSIQRVLSYIYTGHLDITPDSVGDLLGISTLWQLEYVAKCCLEFSKQYPEEKLPPLDCEIFPITDCLNEVNGIEDHVVCKKELVDTADNEPTVIMDCNDVDNADESDDTIIDSPVKSDKKAPRSNDLSYSNKKVFLRKRQHGRYVKMLRPTQYTRRLSQKERQQMALAEKKAADPFYHRGPRFYLPEGIKLVPVENPYICRICSQKFPNQDITRAHLATDHNVNNESDLQRFMKFPCYQPKRKTLRHYGCALEGCQYTSRKILYVLFHRLKYHNIPVPKEWEHHVITCSECGRKFCFRGQYDEHMRGHSNKKEYLCQECGKAFKFSRQLFAHIKTYHTQREFACPYCDYVAKKMWTLNIHIRTHTGEKPFICPHCPFTSASNGYLQTHITKKHCNMNV